MARDGIWCQKALSLRHLQKVYGWVSQCEASPGKAR